MSDGATIGPLEVLHLPGHSPGHLGFHWAERGLVIAGDAIATWPRFEAGWPAFNLNIEQHRESIRRLASLDASIVGVGHGDPVIQDASARVHQLVV